jgi:multimeric flavodoxin WrbA
MKIVEIIGTEIKGCTHSMVDIFISAMGDGHTVKKYILPKDCPVFCTGCKACFFKDINICPHSKFTVPIWDDILQANLLVFASPSYVFHVTAQMKALLDHYATKWMAHSPEQPMFRKQAVIITNAIGQGMGKTARDIKDSLDFWGIARTYVIKQALFQAKWENVEQKRKSAFTQKCNRVVNKIISCKNVKPRIKIKGIFFIMKIAQKMIDKSERKAGRERTNDYLHWEKHGWLNGKKPWS